MKKIKSRKIKPIKSSLQNDYGKIEFVVNGVNPKQDLIITLLGLSFQVSVIHSLIASLDEVNFETADLLLEIKYRLLTAARQIKKL